MTQDEPVRLLLAEDQVMIREALAALLSFEGDIEVVAQVGRGDEVLEASADGRTIAEIAAQLYLSEGTVRNYLSACIGKTGARNRAEALRIASERGWL